jgi:hypothetical protein
MFQIEQQQTQHFEDRAFADFVLRVTAEVREIWPEECRHIGDAETAPAVERAARQALEHGLESEHDVARFVHLVIAFEDPAFDRRSWAREVLERRDMPPRARMDVLWTEARSRLGSPGKVTP